MKKILFYFLFFLQTLQIHASCMPEPHSLTELLLFDSRDRVVFLGEVIRTAKHLDHRYFSEVEVEEVFKGKISVKLVTIETGGNTTAGGFPLETRVKWVFFARDYENNVFGATVCDWMSCNGKTLPDKYYNTLRIVSSFKKMTESHYSGDVIWNFPDGIKAAEGKFKNGKAHGLWKHYWPSGDLKSEMRYKKGVLHGKTIEFAEYKQFTSYSKYKNGVLFSQQKLYTPNDYVSKVAFKVVKTEGYFQLVKSTSWHPNGKQHQMYHHWVQPKKVFDFNNLRGNDGDYIEKDSNGLILKEGTYFHGAKVGYWLETSFNGQKETTYKNYKLPKIPNYDFFVLDEKGQIRIQGNLKNNKPHGKWEYFDGQFGKINKEIEYNEGLRSSKEFDENGREVCHYENDKIQGKSLTYFEDGSIRSEINYENGIKHGSEISYYKKDLIQQKSNYLDGKLHGEYLSLISNGDTLVYGTFKNGALEGKALIFNHQREIRSYTCEKQMGNFVDGFKDGEWKTYDCNGNLIITCFCKKGNPFYNEPHKHQNEMKNCNCD
jgi:antitoxin component YwqK of YwqJK toxin-antitoxin module